MNGDPRNPPRDALGRMVREIWIAWAQEQPSPKASWLTPYDQLSEPDKEVDRRIGETLFRAGLSAGGSPKPRRICAECAGPIDRYHKWYFGEDGRARHRVCSNPAHYHPAQLSQGESNLTTTPAAPASDTTKS